MDLVDVKIVELLDGCGCVKYISYFTGLTLDDLLKKPFNEIRPQLKQLLHSARDRKNTIEKIWAALMQCHKDEDEDEADSIPSQSSLIHHDTSNHPSSFSQSQRQSSQVEDYESEVKLDVTKHESNPVHLPTEGRSDSVNLVTEEGQFEFVHLSREEEQLEFVHVTTEEQSDSVNLVTEKDLDLKYNASVDDDEVEFLEMVVGEVVVEQIKSPEVRNDIIVVDDDEEVESGHVSHSNNNNNDEVEVVTNNQIDTSSNSNNTHEKIGGKRRKLSSALPFRPSSMDTLYKLVGRQRLHVELVDGRNFVKRGTRGGRTRASRQSGSDYTVSQWKELFSFGPHIDTLDCYHWTWTSKDNSPRGSNLYYLLRKFCSNIVQLSILANCTTTPLIQNVSSFPDGFALPYLNKLIINHKGQLVDLNYTEIPLRKIIIASHHLDTIELLYSDEVCLKGFLETLTKLDKSHLQSLKCLSIINDQEEVGLAQIDVWRLSKIEAENLEELILGFGLWDDVGPTFERMLKGFSKLKSLTVHGCFYSNSTIEPFITLNFPKMEHLESIDMGQNYKHVTVLETPDERPAKKRKRAVARREDQGSEGMGSGPSGTESNQVGGEDEEYGLFVSVYLNLPNLPNLSSLKLSLHYNIDYLHFSRMPKLKVFRVGSPWNLTVAFPLSTSRHKMYENIKELQLPDSLQDHTFLEKIPIHFPNLTVCHINLPNVKVLRRFCKVMSDSKLNTLHLRTQFEFHSILDMCFLDKPTKSNVVRNEEEQKWIQTLKEYTRWEEYVKFHNIDVPDWDSVSMLEDGQNFAGIKALKKLKHLILWHIPRKLRLPSGDLHWDDDNCSFTKTVIGFQLYPLSPNAYEIGPPYMNVWDFDLTDINIHRINNSNPHMYTVDASKLVTIEQKKEERPDV